MPDSLWLHGLYSLWNSQARILEPFPSPGDLPNPGIESRCPELRVDSFISCATMETQEYWSGSLSLLQQIFLTQESTKVSCIAGRFFISWATREVLWGSLRLLRLVRFKPQLCHLLAMLPWASHLASVFWAVKWGHSHIYYYPDW